MLYKFCKNWKCQYDNCTHNCWNCMVDVNKECVECILSENCDLIKDINSKCDVNWCNKIAVISVDDHGVDTNLCEYHHLEWKIFEKHLRYEIGKWKSLKNDR